MKEGVKGYKVNFLERCEVAENKETEPVEAGRGARATCFLNISNMATRFSNRVTNKTSFIRTHLTLAHSRLHLKRNLCTYSFH